MTRLLQRLGVVVVALLWAQLSAAQTAEEIIEKSIAAMGGRAAMEKIKTRTATGTLSLGTPGGDISGSIEMYAAAPNKQRTVIKADLTQFGMGPLSVDQRFDGTVGYVTDSIQGNREITGSLLENMKAQGFPHPFLSYKAMGIGVKLGAKEQVAKRDVYPLTFEPATGNPFKQYIDAETFLPTRAVIRVDVPQMGEIEQWIDASDYREIDGVKVPFKLTLTNSMQTITMTFEKIENNTALDEKMFVKPAP
jgi:hypothetical protein